MPGAPSLLRVTDFIIINSVDASSRVLHTDRVEGGLIAVVSVEAAGRCLPAQRCRSTSSAPVRAHATATISRWGDLGLDIDCAPTPFAKDLIK